MLTLINRHTKLFFKDKLSVFFSLLSVFIIILLYVLFLSENITSNLPAFKDKEAFVFLWMFAGIIAVTTATATLGAYGKFIEDKVNKKSEDLLITMVTSRQLAYSYIIYSVMVGIIFTILLLLFGYIYTFINFQMTIHISVSLIMVIFLSVFMHTLLFYLIIANLKTMSAFSGLSTIVGTLIGFLAGIYIPIGLLPPYLQKIITIFPTTQATVLLKDLLMKDVLEPMQQIMPIKDYQELAYMLGVELKWNEHALSNAFSWSYLVGLIIILLGVILIKHRK